MQGNLSSYTSVLYQGLVDREQCFFFSPVIMRSFLSESNELKWMEWMRFSKIRRSSSWPKSGSRPSCELGNLATANLSGAPSLHPSTNYANIRKYTQIYAQIYTNINVSSEGAAANLSGAPFSLSLRPPTTQIYTESLSYSRSSDNTLMLLNQVFQPKHILYVDACSAW